MSVGTEARSTEFLAELRDAIQTAISDAIPERDDAPWVLQIYVQDEPDLTALSREVASYGVASDTAFTQAYRSVFFEHLMRVTQPGGLFKIGRASCRERV